MFEDKDPQRTPLSTLGEFKLIEHLTQHFKIQQESTVKSIGDDAAILEFKSKVGKVREKIENIDFLIEF